jgi:aminopeptidase N
VLLHAQTDPIIGLDVLHYDIQLNIQQNSRTLVGDVTLTVNVQPAQGSFTALDLLGLTVDSVWVNDRPAIFKQDQEFVYPQLQEKKDSTTIRILYHGSPGNSGFGGFFFTERFQFTIGQAIDKEDPGSLRYWVPSHDVPTDKATAEIKICVPDSMRAVSFGDWSETDNPEKGLKEYHFEMNYPIAPYLIALSSGPFEFFEDVYQSVDGRQIPLYYFALKPDVQKAQNDWSIIPEMMRFMEELFGPYPFDHYGMVEIPRQTGAMEHQTMTTISDNLVTGDGRYTGIILHELAHQWWGNWVTLSDWKEIWLNEGFASYCEVLWSEWKYGKKHKQQYLDYFANSYFTEVNRRGEFPVYDPDYRWGGTIYHKAAWILHMLRRKVGDDSFFSTMNRYGQLYAYGNSTISDFKAVAEGVSGKDLDLFFDQWIYDSGIPKLQVSWDYEYSNNQYAVFLQINQTQDTRAVFTVPLDIELLTDTGDSLSFALELTQRKESFRLNSPDRPAELLIDPDLWLLKKAAIVSQPLPDGFLANRPALSHGFPNPFNPLRQKVKMVYKVQAEQAPVKVRLAIYDRAGRLCKTLVEEKLLNGIYRVAWDGRDEQGIFVASGVYFTQMIINGAQLNNKILVIH